MFIEKFDDLKISVDISTIPTHRHSIVIYLFIYLHQSRLSLLV